MTKTCVKQSEEHMYHIAKFQSVLIVRSKNYLPFGPDRCFVLDDNTTQNIEARCADIHGYLPTYRQLVMPHHENQSTLFDALLTYDIDREISQFNMEMVNELSVDRQFSRELKRISLQGQFDYGLCEHRDIDNWIADRVYGSRNGKFVTFKLDVFPCTIKIENGTSTPLKTTPGIVAGVHCRGETNSALFRALKQNNFFNDARFIYRASLLWCNNQIASSFNANQSNSNKNEPEYHTGMKYYNASHVVNEYGELMESMTKGPIIFDECINEVFWMSDYLGTKFRYPCCLNATKRLTIAWAVISELSVLVWTIRFCFSLPFDDDYNREWLFNVEKLLTWMATLFRSSSWVKDLF